MFPLDKLHHRVTIATVIALWRVIYLRFGGVRLPWFEPGIMILGATIGGAGASESDLLWGAAGGIIAGMLYTHEVENVNPYPIRESLDHLDDLRRRNDEVRGRLSVLEAVFLHFNLGPKGQD